MMVKEAVILSGGSGTRLRSVTQNQIPKGYDQNKRTFNFRMAITMVKS